MTRHAVAALLLAASAAAAHAQTAGLTLAEVERAYPRMSPVHINKCDYDNDEIFIRIELLCVSGIYQQMYLDRD